MEKTPEASLEIVVSPTAGFSDATEATLGKAKEAFDALGTLLTDSLEPFRKKVGSVADSADELELRMDLALKGEGKWVVVSMGASASISVRLVWKKKGK